MEEGTICLSKNCRHCNKKLIVSEDKVGPGNICYKCKKDYANKYNKKRAKILKDNKRF